MTNEMRSVSWRSVAIIAGALALVVSCVIFIPLLLQQWRVTLRTEEKATPTLQSYFESGELKWLDNTKSIEALLPYDSISLERGPCFGPCPVYTVTFYRDGHAVLVTDPLLPDHRKRYTGRIWPEGYARLTQLVTSAKIGAPKGNYAGQWTDDSRSIVRATSDGKTWEASDYGEVSPPELWVLIEILHVVREQVEWSPAKGAGG